MYDERSSTLELPEEANMGKIAFVLSGGANRGPLEIGALQSLVAHGIKADLVVGTSAGALNGVYYAARPDRRRHARVGRHLDQHHTSTTRFPAPTTSRWRCARCSARTV